MESYELAPDGRIKTTSTFRQVTFAGKLKKYEPTGFLEDTDSNAVWGMQTVWPFTGDYGIVHVNDDYSQTVIGRNKRDYVWVMARTPEIPREDFDRIVQPLEEQGYDTTKLERLPQRWQ